MEYGQTSTPNCDPRSETPMHDVVSMLYDISEKVTILSEKVTNISIRQHQTDARLNSMIEESHLRQQGRERSMTLTNSSTTPSPSQVRQMLQRKNLQHNQPNKIPENLPKRPLPPKGPYFPPPNYRPPTNNQHKPPFRPQVHIPIISPPQMTQPRPPMNLPPQRMPQAPPRRDNLPPPPPIPPQEPRMINNPLFQYDHETTLNELDNIQQVFHDKYRGNKVNQRGRGQMSLRTSLKNAKRKSKDERQKIESSEERKVTTLEWIKGRKYGVNCFVSCEGTFGGEPLSEVQSTLMNLEEDQATFSRELLKFNEQVQGKENFTLEELQASDLCDVESYDTPPLWDDACDDSFDSTLTLLEESFDLYGEMSQEECVDDSFDSIFILLAKRINFYGEMSKCEFGDALLESEQVTSNDINIKEVNFHLYSNELTSLVFDLDDYYAYLCDDFVECEKESKFFDASTSINCFTYSIPTFERTFSLDFANASMRKGKNVSFGILSDHFEQKEPNFIDCFVKVQHEKVAKGKKGLELTLWHTFYQELFLLPKSKNGMYVWLMLILWLSKAKSFNFEYYDILYMMIHDEHGISLKLSCEVVGRCVDIWRLKFVFDHGVASYHGEVSFFELESIVFIPSYDT
ncbi:hypothetical protein A4A49_33317 [Nicotiana attenuata]|uniref:Uncharacterized protein n=1 Tax=Nicotiana attenuata TaxID=49451 RepID=A0A314KYM9_NICAT|nr:hypothetical protein A4A49_33317 [Nicotiana attenuata]